MLRITKYADLADVIVDWASSSSMDDAWKVREKGSIGYLCFLIMKNYRIMKSMITNVVRPSACSFLLIDKCAGITCVDNARCNSTSGLCECTPPWKPRGAQCLSPDCLVRGGSVFLAQRLGKLTICLHHVVQSLNCLFLLLSISRSHSTGLCSHQDIDCRANSFCQKGLCFCRPGYHPHVDVCVEGKLQ